MPSSEKKTIKYFVGIDPGRNTGICIYDPKRQGAAKIVRLQTLTFWGTVDLLENFKKHVSGPVRHHDTAIPFDYTDESDIDFEVVMEDPQLNGFMFGKKVSKNLSEAVKLSAAQDVGRNKENAFLLIEFMGLKKIKFRTVKPVNRNQGGGKWDDKKLRYYTKYEGRTNEHTRDAIRLVWGL